MLKALVFDFDGVIVDSEPIHCRAFQQVAGELGYAFDYPQYVQRYIGFDDRDAIRQMLLDAHLPPADDAHLAQLVIAKGDAFEHIVRQGITSYPGTLAFIRHAAAQWPLAIASGATRRDIDLILGTLGLAQTFAPIVTADLVRRSKPHPQTYALAVEGLRQRRPELDIQPEDCLAIEDTAAGIASARAAGLLTLALTHTTTAEQLHRAHRVVPSLAEVTLEQLRGWYE